LGISLGFDYDKAVITPAARQILGPLGQPLINPKLAGDGKGGDAYNQGLLSVESRVERPP
jgi:hypothetical protein